jgi:hypothetical protein
VADVGGAAWVSAVAQFLVQLGGVGAAGAPPFAQVSRVLVENAGLPAGAVVDEELFGAGGAGEAADGVAGQAEGGGDLAVVAVLGQQPVDVGVPGRVRPAILPDRGGSGDGSGRGAGAAGTSADAATAAGRCSRWRLTARSTASPRLCHRCQRSATWTASGAPRVPPSE